MTGPQKPPICTDDELEEIELVILKLEQKGITPRKVLAAVNFLIDCGQWNAEQHLQKT